MEKLRDAAINDPYALDQLRHLTDNIGPRLSGSPQAGQAVEYVAAQMRALGAEVTLEKAKVPHWVRGTETAEVVSWPGQTPGTTQKVVLTALGGSVATPAEGLTAEVVVVDDFSQLPRSPPGAVKGKILLFNHKFDKELAAQGHGFQAYGGAVVYRGAGPIAGAAVGAAAVLVRSVGGADFRLPHTGMTAYADKVPKIPAAAVTAEDADMLKDLAGQGPVKLHLTLTPQTLPDADSYNVIADWKGTEHPEQVVIVSGHLDSWDLGTGAIDDGAGVVVSMQAIHLLQQLGIHPRRTVRFIAWMSEEEGSEGAAQYMASTTKTMSPTTSAPSRPISGADHPTGIFYAGKPSSRRMASARYPPFSTPSARRPSILPRNRRRHRRPHRKRRAQLRPHPGQPLLLQLPPHRRRHLRQGRPQTPQRKRRRHGRPRLRPGRLPRTRPTIDLANPMSENWKNYFSKLNGVPASIAVDLALGDDAPILSKPWLLWVRLRFKLPRPDGLSSSEEAPILFAIEDALVEQLKTRSNAIECGRTTAGAERVFYFYSDSTPDFEPAVNDAMKKHPAYKFECGKQSDPSWEKYLNVLYPSEEEFQLVANGDVLGQLMKGGDTLKAEREVTHWIFFESSDGRLSFRKGSEKLGYHTDEEYAIEGEQPYAIRVRRTHAVTPNVIDEVVLELFRLAKRLGGSYDGWETQQVNL